MAVIPRVPAQIRALWHYKSFIVASIKRDFQARYSGSVLGALWNVLNPLVQIVIYTVVFKEVMGAKLKGFESDAFAYSVFLCAGVLSWGLFTEVVSRMQTTFIENATLIKKTNFPRVVLPVITTGVAVLNFAIIFSLFIVFLIVSGNTIALTSGAILAIIPLLLIHLLFAVGLGLATGTLNVFVRDIGQIVAVVLQFWFWLTPMVYPTSALPAWALPYVNANPLARLAQCYQGVFLEGRWPTLEQLWLPTVTAIVFAFIGGWIYKRLAPALVDEL